MGDALRGQLAREVVALAPVLNAMALEPGVLRRRLMGDEMSMTQLAREAATLLVGLLSRAMDEAQVMIDADTPDLPGPVVAAGKTWVARLEDAARRAGEVSELLWAAEQAMNARRG